MADIIPSNTSESDTTASGASGATLPASSLPSETLAEAGAAPDIKRLCQNDMIEVGRALKEARVQFTLANTQSACGTVLMLLASGWMTQFAPDLLKSAPPALALGLMFTSIQGFVRGSKEVEAVSLALNASKAEQIRRATEANYPVENFGTIQAIQDIISDIEDTQRGNLVSLIKAAGGVALVTLGAGWLGQLSVPLLSALTPVALVAGYGLAGWGVVGYLANDKELKSAQKRAADALRPHL